jgi:hypothetical protein
VGIRLCPSFWQNFDNDRAGIIIRQASRILNRSPTNLAAVGFDACKNLVIQGRLKEASRNADSIKYFAVNAEELP